MTRDDYGTVYLVGAGPGDPDLLTVRADRLVRTADAVLHDSLVGSEIVSDLPSPTADVIDVGKRPEDGTRWRQDEIDRCLVRTAREAETVVRLKGGDPTVFGRGGEEGEYLAERGVPFEVVPGVTSAIAAPALSGIPVTHREHASSLSVVTGHEDPTKDESALDWEALSATVVAGGTLVILMGVGRLPENAAALREHGVPRETPVAIVEKACRPDGGVTTATLDTVVDRAEEADVSPPAVIVVGEVVSVREAVRDVVADALGRPSVGAGSAGADGTGTGEEPAHAAGPLVPDGRGP